MAKINSQALTAALAAVRQGAFEFMGVKAGMVLKVQLALKAGAEPKAVQHEFMVGAAARTLTRTTGIPGAGVWAKAEAEIADKAKTNKLRASAMRAWSYVASDAGIRVSKRGRKAGVKVGKPKAAKGSGVAQDAPQLVKVDPSVKDTASALQHVRSIAMMLSGFCKKNDKLVSAEVMACVADFTVKINKLT